MSAIYWKELTDHFSSWRFIILLAIICFTTGFAVYNAAGNIIDDVAKTPTENVFLRLFTTSGDNQPAFLWFIAVFGPFIGIIFGFDAVNSERTRGTLSRIISQPLFRDSVIAGKFLAGMTTIAIMMASIVLMMSGLGLHSIGVSPSSGEVTRILIFYLISVLYLGFWLGLGILASVLFRRVIVSALVTIAIWIFAFVFVFIIAGVIADAMEPLGDDPTIEAQINHSEIENNIARVSPVRLFDEAAEAVLNPERRILHDYLIPESLEDFSPLSLKDSLNLVASNLITLLALTAVCFAVAYLKFLKEEIRST